MALNIISTKQFDRESIHKIFSHTDAIINWTYDPCTVARGKIMATLFYEPSTRTRLSFESAMLRLGGNVISTENAKDFSSAIKGETLEDTIRVVGEYADVIVLRHPESDAAEKASKVSRVPLINAGTGDGEHPSQALLDFYTIKAELGRTDNLRISLVGDLRYGRTIHSLIHLLRLYDGIEIQLVSPLDLTLPKELGNVLSGIKVETTSDFNDVAKFAPNVVYMTRLQTERMSLDNRVPPYILDKRQMEKLPKDCIVMHPLPRRIELPSEVDSDPRVACFRQARNGLFVRMGILVGMWR